MLIKYNSIDNHYLTKTVEHNKKYFGGLVDNCLWDITEKIHGANISFYINQNHPTQFFSRNQEIIGNSFMNSEEILQETDKNLTALHNFCTKYGKTIRLFGEFFGPGIQKGVDYGTEKRIMFFDMMVDDRFVSQQTIREMMHVFGCSRYFSESLAIYHTLDEALQHPSEFNSTYNDKDNNICEGVVIKPLYCTLIDSNGSPFYLKKKNQKFLEKKQTTAKEKKSVTSEVHKWYETFLSYVNANTLESVFSKEGRIDNIKDLGKYIPLIILEASDTFYREEDFPVDKYTKDEHKYIFNAGKEIAKLLKEEL